MTRTQRFFSITALGLALAACGEKGRDAADKAEDVVNLQGSYQTSPRNELSLRTDGIGCVVHNVDIKALTLTLKQSYFAKADCTGDALGEVLIEGNINVGAELPIAPGARALDLTIAKASITPRSQDWLEILDLDASGNCAVGNVLVGQSRDVTGLDCGALGRLPAKDQVFYTSFLLDGKVLRMTLPPNELADHVGNSDNPPERAQELRLDYLRK